MSETPSRRPIERRLADAGLPPLPRMAWLEIDLDALSRQPGRPARAGRPGRPGPPGRQGRRLRPRRGPGRTGARGRRRRRLLRGRHRRGARAARRRRARADPRPVPDPAGPGPARRPAWASRSTGGDGPALAETVRAAIGVDRRPAAGRRARGRDRARPRRAGGERDLVAAARAWSRRRRASSWPASGPTSRPSRTRPSRRRRSPVRGGRRALAAAGIDLPPRHVAASAALLTDGVVAYDGVRPGLAIYGLVPDELEPSARLGTGGRAAAPGHVAARPAGPRRGPARRLGHQLRPDVPDRTAEPDRHAPAGLRRRLVAAALQPGQRDRPGPAASRWSGTWRWTRSWPTSPTSPALRSTTTTSSCSSAGPATVRIGAEEVAQERTTNSWEVVTGMARRLPRVYHAAAGPVGLRTLTERRG